MVSNELLRRDVRMLGDMLGEVITSLSGSESFNLVEQIRQLSRARRGGEPSAELDMTVHISALNETQAEIVTRAFSIFFDLANLAEDRHRIRVLRSRERERHPEPIGESIGAAVVKLHELGFSGEQVQQALDKVDIELVFTAHPSEAKRRAIRAKLRRMRQYLQELDREDLLPRERQRWESRLRTELTILWQTEFLRPWRPTVLQEVERCLSIAPRLWEAVPQVYEALRRALQTHYPHHEFQIPLFLRFGSWVGGDRDGHPQVTADVTTQTLVWLREAAVARHLTQCRHMYDFLSISAREGSVSPALQSHLDDAKARWPELMEVLTPLAPLEVYRQFLAMIEWRLQQSLSSSPVEPLADGGYRDGSALVGDLRLLRDSLRRIEGQRLVADEVEKWLDLARIFGLHLARLDVRQDARRHAEVMSEIMAVLDLSADFGDLSDEEKLSLLTRTMPWQQAIPEESLSPLARETLALYRLLQGTLTTFGPEAIGGHVISLTRAASDVLTVLWLWRWAQSTAPQHSMSPPNQRELKISQPELRIIPLFEKIGDLKQAPETLAATLANPMYADHLARMGNRQVVMVGYSDSTKDGGYLAACWGLYRAQSELTRVAAERGVKLTFFHGRGGSLGRGGGPAARGILSLPPEALDGTLRLTEQGEVLAERYDDPQIAYRHLEQVTWATLLASAVPVSAATPAWTETMNHLAQRSLEAYRELVDLPGFLQFFADATPIEEIEDLPIGSRPSRRRGERTLSDLRAIPWVFSWTQNRSLIPAWYGLGTALTEVKYRDRGAWQAVCEMYRQWPFLQATIDNAALALAKADMYIAQCYAELSNDQQVRQKFWTLIASERDRTRQAILDLVGGSELLSNTPWFQGSIEVRNPYIDPLNLIQIELLRHRRALPADRPNEESERLRHLLRLTVQGIAAGMRTTG